MMEWWKNKIVKYDTVSPATIVKNVSNYRRHPLAQRKALQATIGEVGFVQPVLVNINTNRIVDGHLRVDLALEQKVASLPVIYIDVTENEEKKLLSTIDPITNMAVIDQAKFDEILMAVSSESQIVNDMWDAMKREAPVVAKKPNPNVVSEVDAAAIEDAAGETVAWEKGAKLYTYDREAGEGYLANSVRTISMYLKLEDYKDMIVKMDALLEYYDFKSYQELIVTLVKDNYEAVVSPSE